MASSTKTLTVCGNSLSFKYILTNYDLLRSRHLVSYTFGGLGAQRKGMILNMENEIIVSVFCLTYNHEEYVRDALNGFIMQETNFKYEVFVHDDASTDNTAKIIDEYAKKYPSIIKPIYEIDNQYSKGISITRQIMYPLMSGKYIAICEGDDYWCDKYKLQKQVDFLEKNNKYSACVHNTKVINCVTKEVSYINDLNIDTDLEFEKVIERGNSQFQLSSLVCRKEFFCIPDEIVAKGFGDYPLAIYLILKGKIHYFNDVMSVYRLFANGSWTSRYCGKTTLYKQIEYQRNLVDFLNRLFQYCEKIQLKPDYIEKIRSVKRIQNVNLLMLENNGREVLKNYRDIYYTFSIKDKIKARIPLIRNCCRKIKILLGKFK